MTIINIQIKKGDESIRELKVIKEDIEEENSKSFPKSDSHGELPNVEEVKANPKEIKLLKLHQKFETDDWFTKSTSEFINKMIKHFKAKYNPTIEWTSYVNDVHNLFTMHIGKAMSKNKLLNIDDETKNDYFLYLLKVTNERGLFVGEIFEYWKQGGCKTLQDMNKCWMITAHLERSDVGKSESMNQNNQDAYNKTFNAIFKTLYEQNFWQPSDGNRIQKPKYLSNIQSFINEYAKSKEWSENEKTLIKSEKKTKIYCLQLFDWEEIDKR